MIHDPIFDKMFKTIRDIDDGKYELQTLDTYYPLIETQLRGKDEMGKIKYIASLLQEIDFMKSQQKEEDLESKYSRYVTLLFHRQDEKFQETVLNQLRKEHGPGNFSEIGIKAVQEPTSPGYPGKQK